MVSVDGRAFRDTSRLTIEHVQLLIALDYLALIIDPQQGVLDLFAGFRGFMHPSGLSAR
jgi:hypothetical protein